MINATLPDAPTLDTADFPALMTTRKPSTLAPAPINRRKGVSLDLAEEARREHDADCDAYHAWQSRYSAWLDRPNGQPQPY